MSGVEIIIYKSSKLFNHLYWETCMEKKVVLILLLDMERYLHLRMKRSSLKELGLLLCCLALKL